MERYETFSTLQGVTELFSRVNGIGSKNNICLVTNEHKVSGKGVAYLLNQTDAGLGMIPLMTKEDKLSHKTTDYIAILESYVFYPNDEIAKLSVKNHTLLNKSIKDVTIKTMDGKKYNLSLAMKDKHLNYQTVAAIKFYEMNRKKNKTA